MIARQHAGKIALVCDYLPRQCGIATFSHDVRQSLLSQYPGLECMVIPTTDTADGYNYPPEVRFEIPEQDLKAYERAAEFINFSDAEVVLLQHEFGIFGGVAGSHILTLLRELRIPVVSQLHTVLDDPKPAYRRVMNEIVQLSSRLIVMNDHGRHMIETIYGASPDRVDVIPHGIPDMPFVDPNFYKDGFGVEGRKVLLTFGLLTENKGIEYVIQALPEVVKHMPDVVYVVLGATHPALQRTEGEAYRIKLERLVASLGLTNHVVFYNRFVSQDELMEFLGACDLYITPYLTRAQISSGTLSYAFGCGKAVISTPYWHAEELLAEGRGALVPFRDSAALAKEIIGLLSNEVRRHSLRKQAYLMGRDMIWSNVAHRYMDSFQKARLGPANRRVTLRTLDQPHYPLPSMQLSHLERLTDSVGLFHNATHSVPDVSQGYRTFDNALALRLLVLLEETGDAPARTQALATTYAAFLNYALIPATGHFHEHLSFERQWLDTEGSDEALAAAVWALGTCIGRSQSAGLQQWAAHLLDRALPLLGTTRAPGAWALGLLGIHEYFRRLSGDHRAKQLRETLTRNLLDAFNEHATEERPWFEATTGSAGARLSHALILSGRWSGDQNALDVGLRSLRWLLSTHTNGDHYRAVCARPADEPRELQSNHNQLPIEASAMVGACIEAYAATQDTFWQDEAHKAFEWFLGRNDLGESLYDPATGGCCDVLHVDRRNLNQGAESTLAFLLGLQEMRLLDAALRAFNHPAAAGVFAA